MPVPGDTLAQPMKTSTDEFQAAPSLQTSFPRLAPAPNNQNKPFRRTLKGLWAKRANMSTVTILVAGKTTKNDVRATPTTPKAANLTGLRRIETNFNEHTKGYVHYLLGCKCYSLSNSTHIWHFCPLLYN